MSILINAYSTLKKPPALDFTHQLNNRRDLADPELSEHLNGLIGYILEKGGEPMTATKYHTLRHVERVVYQLSFDMEEKEFDALAHWAYAANAVLFLPDGTVRSPNGAVLVYADGRAADEDAEVPFVATSYQRKATTEAMLQQRDIAVSQSLPPLHSELELSVRPQQAILERAMALFAVAVRAESIAAGDPLPLELLQQKLPLSFKALSPAEHHFLYNDVTDEATVTQFSWRYEGVTLLLWALGILPELPFPDTICDVPRLGELALTLDEWQNQIVLRPISEIIDCLDLHYRLHWVCRQADIDGKQPPAALESGVVLERHYALNWLTYFENADWDEVDTPT